jgi:hypothetical protein
MGSCFKKQVSFHRKNSRIFYFATDFPGIDPLTQSQKSFISAGSK